MRTSLVIVAAGALWAGVAEAHVSISSGPAAANKSQKMTFAIGHGCEGADTLRVRIEIPAGISSVRALRSDFGKPTLDRNGTTVTAVTWQKPDGDVLEADLGYYELTIRARVADQPFSKIYFRVDQTCRTPDGDVTVSWSARPGEPGNEAPALTVVPSRQAGWNKYVLGASTTIAQDDLPAYFGDALIVWRGTEAYSSNPHTAALIGTTAGVTALTGGVAAGQEIWVKY